MFRNRCYDRPMAYSSESMQFSSTNVNSEYPTAMPQGMTQGMPQVGMGMSTGMPMGMGCPTMGCQMPPVQECPQERVVNREFVHEVPHIVPINTRIINHHIYRHSYTPCYTCCEENVVCNVYDGCPNNF